MSELYSEKEITVADALDHGLTEEEFEKIEGYLGRRPTVTELGIYSGLWSEHCSYKNSILLLKTLPTESTRLAAKTGEENAGALDIGDGLCVVFKIESHNHPTAVEPYQGAATGVGGIMRDIFTMGARPICSLNSLRFGPPTDKRNRYLLTRAVKGIGDYGNSLGVPVSGGEILFDESYSRNCLVNAMTVGIVRRDRMVKATAAGKGNPVFYVGAKTGRDGIHGASFASQDLSQESESRRSAVQVGDPFMEKLLMEASLELAQTDSFIGMQDMGAAGLSCASSEMSAKGNVGMDLNLDLVPLREKGMNAYEIMLSESQERMLVVGKLGQEKTITDIFHRWGLDAVQIGTVTDDGKLNIRWQNKHCASIPASSLVLGGGAPRYKRETRKPEYLETKRKGSEVQHPAPVDALIGLLSSPNVCSRRPVVEQYDAEVGLGRVLGPGGDGGVARVPGSRKGIAVSTDCNSRFTYLNPRQGAALAVFESARNVAVTGALPIGITNCLNFGNPKIPENYYVFSECIGGMADACRALGIPVTGGNVSFYNESEEGPILPTPTIGMVGLIENVDKAVPAWFQKPGDEILLIGNFAPVLGGSEYLKLYAGKIDGEIPRVNADAEVALVQFLVKAAESGLLASAKDLSLGGLACALSKSILSKNLDPRGRKASATGFHITSSHFSDNVAWFGETAGCAIVSVSPDNVPNILKIAADANVPAQRIGNTTGDGELNFGKFKATTAQASEAFEKGLVQIFA
ncbi:MAG: phosphoribosylformylglycinamidine synthase subunit PurL [Leptospirales bacterium]|nr:phosphoribosylformylglycinamidine synthase subunit PurL [Leptospirales bacterium]